MKSERHSSIHSKVHLSTRGEVQCPGSNVSQIFHFIQCQEHLNSLWIKKIKSKQNNKTHHIYTVQHMVESKNWQFSSDFLWIVIWIWLTSQAHALSAWPWIGGKMLKPAAPLGGEGSGDGDAEVGQRWEGLGRLCLSLVLTSSTAVWNHTNKSKLQSPASLSMLPFHHISAYEMPQPLCFPLLPSAELSNILFQQGERKLTDHVILMHTWTPSVSAGAGVQGEKAAVRTPHGSRREWITKYSCFVGSVSPRGLRTAGESWLNSKTGEKVKAYWDHGWIF